MQRQNQSQNAINRFQTTKPNLIQNEHLPETFRGKTAQNPNDTAWKLLLLKDKNQDSTMPIEASTLLSELRKEITKDKNSLRVPRTQFESKKLSIKPCFRLSEDMDQVKQLFRLSELPREVRSLTRKKYNSNYSRKIKWDADYYKNRLRPREEQETTKAETVNKQTLQAHAVVVEAAKEMYGNQQSNEFRLSGDNIDSHEMLRIFNLSNDPELDPKSVN